MAFQSEVHMFVPLGWPEAYFTDSFMLSYTPLAIQMGAFE